jgi:hypothetical protein
MFLFTDYHTRVWSAAVSLGSLQAVCPQSSVSGVRGGASSQLHCKHDGRQLHRWW